MRKEDGKGNGGKEYSFVRSKYLNVGRNRNKGRSLKTLSVFVMFLTVAAISLLVVSLILGLYMNRNLAQEYIADTGELYIDRINRDMMQISSELVALRQSDENIKKLSENVVPYHADDYQILTRLVAQNKVLKIRYQEVQSFFVYVHHANALVTENGTCFTDSVKSDLTEQLMVFLQKETEKDSLSTKWTLLSVEEEHYIVGWYGKSGKAIGCVIDLDTIFRQFQADTQEYKILPYLKSIDQGYILPDYVDEKQQETLRQGFYKSDRYSVPLGSVGTMYFYVYESLGMVGMVYQMQMILSILLIVLLLASFVAGYIYYQRILEPIRRFADGLQNMDEEQFLNADKTNNLLELESANSKFRELMRKIQSLKIAIYEKELNEQRAELEYAQEQIRPHFYLNCISLIHGIADRKAEKEIIHITEVLSDYIRYIFRDYKKLMNIGMELEHVNAYVEIQRLRYGEDAFSYEVILDGDVETCLVPSLLLQTLVENSVVHAVSLDRKIEISLYITREMYHDIESIYICVSDTGNGFSEEILQAIEKDETIFYNGRKHVGLQNIRRRLELLYGKKANAAFSNMAENYGAVVEIHVPVMKENTDKESTV